MWENVELNDPEGWFEYCDGAGASVGITELTHEWRVHKEKK